MSTTPTPPNGMVSNTELILRKILGEDVTPLSPNSRVEFYLTQVKEYIERLATGATRPIGETTTPLTDGATTNPIVIDGESYTAQINDLVFYQNKEFLFTANGWREVGDITNLNADMIDDSNTTNKFATQAQLDQIGTNKNNILMLHNQNNKQYKTMNIMSDMTFYTNGYVRANGEITTGTPSHAVYSMPLGNIKEVVFDLNTILDTSLGYGVVKRANGTIRQAFPSNGKTGRQIFTLINPDPTDTLYISQYSISNPTTIYDSFDYRDYEYLSDIYESNILDITGSGLYYNYINRPIDFVNKKLQFFGDSITYGYIAGSPYKAENNYPKVFSNTVDAASHINSAVSGSTLSLVTGYDCIYTTIQDSLDTTADVVFVAGGVNDYMLGVDASALTTAMDNICNYLTQNYTGEVIFITPINEAGKAPIKSPTQTLNSVRQIITEKAIENSFNVVQGWQFPFPTKNRPTAYIETMFQDKIHPTELGYAIYAKALASALL